MQMQHGACILSADLSLSRHDQPDDTDMDIDPSHSRPQRSVVSRQDELTNCKSDEEGAVAEVHFDVRAVE